MNVRELNNKHSKIIEQGFGGIESNFEPITNYLDRLLRLLIHRNPSLRLKQIKMKCQEVCFKSNLHDLYNDDDRQRDRNVSVKIQSKLDKQRTRY
ncbi:hypothetical protein LPTSP2_38390 [Leptospira ellinghausenii]|uniref:Uncharacterized protein n=1 Tax=Leptospira ellinghausenii TaxID=1917822 RepID=A0A2P2DIQ1_9LEPT|nr:hypothetical protein LPTSP2_38390 [Leptospira ellinghausenii]